MKKDIKETQLGLNFINDLKPVSYILKSDKENKTQYGIIAQDVVETLHKFNITDPKEYGFISGEEGSYGAMYSNFISPLIKAIQELDSKVEQKDEKITALENKLESQQNAINSLMERLDKLEDN